MVSAFNHYSQSQAMNWVFFLEKMKRLKMDVIVGNISNLATDLQIVK